MSLLELMLAARKGRAASDFGLQFGLSEADVGRVLGQLVPLFGDAVTRVMLTPQGLAALLGQLASPQHERDQDAADLFQNSRILSNGTGLLSLLLRNEATIKVIACYAGEAAKVNANLVRRMMPYVATFYMAALTSRSRLPLEKLAERIEAGRKNAAQPGIRQGSRRLAEHILHLSQTPAAAPTPSISRDNMTIKDILVALSNLEKEEEQSRA